MLLFSAGLGLPVLLNNSAVASVVTLRCKLVFSVSHGGIQFPMCGRLKALADFCWLWVPAHHHCLLTIDLLLQFLWSGRVGLGTCHDILVGWDPNTPTVWVFSFMAFAELCAFCLPRLLMPSCWSHQAVDIAWKQSHHHLLVRLRDEADSRRSPS